MNAESPTAPAANPPHKAPVGLRTVAIYEFVKGLVVLVLGMGLLSLVHKDVANEAEDFIRSLHLDPAWHYCRWLIDHSAKLTDDRLRLLSFLAAVYSALRFVITYGLWHEKHWAEWLTAISAGLYIPFEIQHLIVKPGLGAAIVPILNFAVVIYLARVIMANRRRKKAAATQSTQL